MTYQIPLDMELIVDNFAGGGGASAGIEMALRRPVNIAINHDQDAIGMHTINHPLTKHYCENVWDVDPKKATGGRRVMLGWFSPDCKHHSKARGQKPVEKNIRGLAWIVLKWAGKTDMTTIFLENVEEFQDWSPLIAKRCPNTGRVLKKDGTVAAKGERVPLQDQQLIPDKRHKGRHFAHFIAALRKKGYAVEWRELRACDYGAPTIRKRLFLIARKDGKPIIWPKPTHAKKPARGSGLKPYRTAADCIDWSIPCPSIFERDRPLAENTMRRIAAGLKRFVVDNPNPFIVTVNHGSTGNDFRGQDINDPLHTVTQKNGFGLVETKVAPFITEHANGSNQRNMPSDEPLRTQCAQVKGGHFAVVSPLLVGAGGSEYAGKPRPADAPLNTVKADSRQALIVPMLSTYYGHKKPEGDPRGCAMDSPIGTQTTENRHALVAASMVQVGYGERPGEYKCRACGDTFKDSHATGIATLAPAECPRCGEEKNIEQIRSPQAPRAIDLENPLGTVVGSTKHGLVTAWLTKHFGGVTGVKIDTPMPTVMTRGTQTQITTAHIMKMRGENLGHGMDDPLHTVSDGGLHHAKVQAFLLKYYGNEKDGQDLAAPMGTVTTKDRFGLVTIHGELYQIVDIGMRMLTPRELARAQGFPDDYVIDKTVVAVEKENGVTVVEPKPLTKTAQVRMIGNSVCPPLARALVEANVPRYAALNQPQKEMEVA